MGTGFFIYICSKPQREWQESMVQDSGVLQSSDRELRLRSPLFADLQIESLSLCLQNMLNRQMGSFGPCTCTTAIILHNKAAGSL